MSTPFLKIFVFLQFLSFLQIVNAKIVKNSIFTNEVFWVYNIKARIGAHFFLQSASGYINLMMFTSLMRQIKVLYTTRARSLCHFGIYPD